MVPNLGPDSDANEAAGKKPERRVDTIFRTINRALANKFNCLHDGFPNKHEGGEETNDQG